MTEPLSTETALVPAVAGPEARSRVPVVRLDTLVWLGLIAAAAALRLARLDALPLTFDESARAFDALRVSQNSVPDGWTGDLAISLTSYLFRIFGESELVARIAPAAAGSLMIAVVWLGGRGLGRTGALVAGALLALSSLAVLLSRTAVPFALGGLLAVVMMAALFSYLREPRALTVFLFAVAFGLAPSTDVVAVTAAIAVVVFLVADPLVAPGGEVARAWSVFRRTPSHWLSVVLVMAAAAELGLTHFGTSLDRIGLAGLSQWSEMVSLPWDDRGGPEYQVALLLAYDWPILLAGGLGAGVFGWRLVHRGAGALTSAQRFVLAWTVLATLVVALTSQRQAGQLLVIIVPLALLGGLLAADVAPTVNWAILRRWWPAAVLALVLLGYAALITSEWSGDGITRVERFYLALALGGAVAVIVSSYSLLGRDAIVVGGVVVAVVALAFGAHTSLGLAGNDEAAEFAVDVRTTTRIERFRETVSRFAASRGRPVLVDPALGQPLSWYLRDLPVTFARPGPDAGVVVVPAGAEVGGFTRVGDAWRLGEGWYPPSIDPLALWRWLVAREAYGNLDGMERLDVEILVPEP